MFKNRQEAGLLLAEKITQEIEKLEIEKLRETMIVLGIPRGGIVVAKQVAEILNCPLDIIVVRKIGAQGNQELAIGAIGETNGAKYLDSRMVQELGIDSTYLEQAIKAERLEIKRREKIYRQGKEPLLLKNKTIIIIDDGAATGATMIAAAREVWNNDPKRVIIAVPVVAKDTLVKLEKEADEVIYLEAPEQFFSVGQFYEEFGQLDDDKVIRILNSKY